MQNRNKPGFTPLLVNGEIMHDRVPEAALPDCEICAKPELDESSLDAVHLYGYVVNQQTWDMAGHRMGLRAEAVIQVLDELCAAGIIEDRDRAFRRVWVIDDEVNGILNERLDAQSRLRDAERDRKE